MAKPLTRLNASSHHSLDRAFHKMFSFFGPRHWWPGESKFEIIVGAVLTQNTNWKNVEKALQNLKAARVLTAEKIHQLPENQLAELIRPSGYFRLKAKRLQCVVAWFIEKFQGRIEELEKAPLPETRDSLLQVWGVGPETADSILCYAGGHLTFVVDLYTKRVLTRHQWIPENPTYESMQKFFHKHLTKDWQVYNEFHAQIVGIGNRFCSTKPKCEGCPLESMLPKN